MSLSIDVCYPAILQLQKNALNGLRQRDRFKESGVATVKLRVLSPNSSPTMVLKELPLSSLGSELKGLVSGDSEIPCHK